MIAGIDYSMTSPCICCYNGERYYFYYLTTKKKFEGIFESRQHNMTFEGSNINHIELGINDRFDEISDWAIQKLRWNSVTEVLLEDYSFASTGRVFHIGENTGLLKYKLKRSIIPFTTVAPTVIKKYATGKGNAGKDQLNESFIEQTGLDVKQLLEQTEKQWNPSSDIIDSYYLARLLSEGI